MKLQNNKDYFFYSFFTIVFAIVAFIGFKHFLPGRLFPDSNAVSPNIVIDSLAIAAMQVDTTTINDSCNIDSLETKNNKIELASTLNMEGYSNIVSFYEKLYTLEKSDTKNEKIRIAYFSDSMTDGDYIVQDIRRQYQKKYGGEGVGFVGITSLSAQSRYSVSHRYSNNWQTKSFLKQGSGNNMFGIDGQVVFCKSSGSYTLEYKANDISGCEALNNPTLFYGSATNDRAYINISEDDKLEHKIELKPDATLNTIRLSSKSPQRIKLEFQEADSIPFYGVNFDNSKGIHIDNFSMRGNSGLPLSLLNKNLMQSFNRHLKYDLIILHYGANVLGYGTTDYSWYDKKMTMVVNHLRECFPKADILIVSVSDKASKEDMEMKTDKAVRPLVKSQKRYAEATNSAFINLFNLMGGENSMVKWVEEKPSLANKDYTHFNVAGSRKVATLIFDEIEKGYTNYKKMRMLNE